MSDDKYKKNRDIVVLKEDEVLDKSRSEDIEVNGPVSQVRQQQQLNWQQAIRATFPDDLQGVISWFCHEDETLLKKCFEVFTTLGREGMEIVLNLEFLHKIKVGNDDAPMLTAIRYDTASIRQEIDMLVVLLRNTCKTCLDFQIDPLPLLANLIKSKPGVSFVELVDMIQQVLLKMIIQAYLIRAHLQLASIVWDWDEFWILKQNFEMVMLHDGRDDAFKYLRTYLNSCQGGSGARKNLH